MALSQKRWRFEKKRSKHREVRAQHFVTHLLLRFLRAKKKPFRMACGTA
jgi:hypothetical protein